MSIWCDILPEIQKAYGEHGLEFSRLKGVTQRQLERFESKIQLELPHEFREMYLTCNGSHGQIVGVVADDSREMYVPIVVYSLQDCYESWDLFPGGAEWLYEPNNAIWKTHPQIDPRNTQKGVWLPFAYADGGVGIEYKLDLLPSEGGQLGQVFGMKHSGLEDYWPSLQAFMLSSVEVFSSYAGNSFVSSCLSMRSGNHGRILKKLDTDVRIAIEMDDYEKIRQTLCGRWKPGNTDNTESIDDALEYALGAGKRAIAEMIVVECGFSLSSAFYTAAEIGDVSFAKYIVSIGYDIHNSDEDGNTAFALSVYAGSGAVVEYLISEGCDVNAVDDDGESIADIAMQGRITDEKKRVLQLLKDAGAEGVSEQMCSLRDPWDIEND